MRSSNESEEKPMSHYENQPMPNEGAEKAEAEIARLQSGERRAREGRSFLSTENKDLRTRITHLEKGLRETQLALDEAKRFIESPNDDASDILRRLRTALSSEPTGYSAEEEKLREVFGRQG